MTVPLTMDPTVAMADASRISIVSGRWRYTRVYALLTISNKSHQAKLILSESGL